MSRMVIRRMIRDSSSDWANRNTTFGTCRALRISFGTKTEHGHTGFIPSRPSATKRFRREVQPGSVQHYAFVVSYAIYDLTSSMQGRFRQAGSSPQSQVFIPY